MISESYRNLIAKHEADTLAWKKATGGTIDNATTQERLVELTKYSAGQHPSLNVPTKDGCGHFSYINDYPEIQGWRKFFSQAGVQPQDIAEVCHHDLPEGLAEWFGGLFTIRFNNVTEEQFKAVVERLVALRANDGVDQRPSHDEFNTAYAVEQSILTQLRTIHRTHTLMVGELQKYVARHKELLTKTYSNLLETETIFNGDECDEDRDSILDLIDAGNIEDAGMRLFALDQYGPYPCYDEDGNEPTDADYDEHFDSLFDAADHWLDAPEEWTAHCEAEREKYLKKQEAKAA
jgi:hypothetical protein